VNGQLLLDANILIWWLSEPERLPADAVDALADPADVHAWIVEREQWMLFPVQGEHIQVLDDLPSPHRDPFDRLLVAQAIAERLTLVSGDSVLLVFSARAVAAGRVVCAAAGHPAGASTPWRFQC